MYQAPTEFHKYKVLMGQIESQVYDCNNPKARGELCNFPIKNKED